MIQNSIPQKGHNLFSNQFPYRLQAFDSDAKVAFILS